MNSEKVEDSDVKCNNFRICIKCGEMKNFDEFHKDNWHYPGVIATCKKCRHAKQKEWRDANEKKASENNKKWRLENEDKVKIDSKAYRLKNKEKLNAYRKEWRNKNPTYQKEYRAVNKDKRSKRQRNNWRNNPKHKLNCTMSSTIRRGLANGKEGKGWKDLVNFTLEELMGHFEKLFTSEMTWEMFLKGEIHLDHKIPLAVFNFKTINDLDFKRAWALENLQPLFAKDNLTKGKKIEAPFQPSFAFGNKLSDKGCCS